MFSRKKDTKRTPRSNNQYNLPNPMDFGVDTAGDEDDDGDDEELEAELRRLTSGDDTYKPSRPKAPPRRPKKIEVAEKTIPFDEEMSGDDDDDDDDGEDDPAILDELKGILGEDGEENDLEHEEVADETENKAPAVDDNSSDTVKLLEERLLMYKAAEKKAKSENDMGRARRFGRGLKNLQGLLTSAKSGKPINPEDISPILPPSALPHDPNEKPVEAAPLSPIEEPTPMEEPVTTPTDPTIPAEDPAPATHTIDQETLDILKIRQQEYRIAAVKWKKVGNVEQALSYVKIAKRFDMVIAAMMSGEPIDLSDMPPSPSLPTVTTETTETTGNTENTEAPEKEESETQEASSELAPVTGSGIEGALKERLEVYRRTKTAAEQENNSTKVRRYGRICKQYEDAIKLHARGKPIPIDDLPVPPGFPPIVLNIAASAPNPLPTVPSRPAPRPPVDSSSAEEQKVPAPKPRPVPPKSMSRSDKQTLLLQRRQAELKRAALTAKKDGDLELAREYLRQAKGIDPLINASNGGLPVDMSSIPISPNAKTQLESSTNGKSDESFSMVSSEECQPIDENSTDQEIYDNLEATLIKHKKACLVTRDHAKALGDVPGYNRWERLALGYAKDLDMLRVRRRDGLPPPRHHYEVKTYAIVQSSTDLGDGDIEISIIRGINYPKEADTYVIYEFPYPTDSPPSDKTSTIKDSTNPEYEATFTLNGVVDRTARQCQRAFKRHALKCQVWSKGGFFRSDSLLGTVTIKLQPLESQCTLHDSFPLMNGRKVVGGKLEVKLRLRNPITTKQIEKMTDKWLIIDN